MLRSLSNFINEYIGFDGKLQVESRKTNRVGIYRYQYLDTAEKPSAESKPKKRVRFEAGKPLMVDQKEVASCVCDNKRYETTKNNINFVDADNNEKAAVKIKILMTKKEAVRLLSKCKDGGVLEFQDVARELVHIPINRVSLVSSSNSASTNDYCSFQNINVKKQ